MLLSWFFAVGEKFSMLLSFNCLPYSRYFNQIILFQTCCRATCTNGTSLSPSGSTDGEF